MLRNNFDYKYINNSGKCFLNFCKEFGLWILNGRIIGDLIG